MRSMSLDVGTRTIGVAASDLMGMIANGVETIVVPVKNVICSVSASLSLNMK